MFVKYAPQDHVEVEVEVEGEFAYLEFVINIKITLKKTKVNYN